jgi:hypothetical protein
VYTLLIVQIFKFETLKFIPGEYNDGLRNVVGNNDQNSEFCFILSVFRRSNYTLFIQWLPGTLSESRLPYLAFLSKALFPIVRATRLAAQPPNPKQPTMPFSQKSPPTFLHLITKRRVRRCLRYSLTF